MIGARHTVLGIMSGSSLDGIDLAVCTFQLNPAATDPVEEWSVVAADTVAYPAEWKDRLQRATECTTAELLRLDAELGDWIGQQAAAFLDEKPRPGIVGCHGHTVYHEPELGYTLQIGHGARIAGHLGVPVVTDLRSADIAAGGQGAPLAPVADRHLFPQYAAFLNLGGIANFSLRLPSGDYAAGDVSGCCQIMDRLARETGAEYDDDGKLARSGHPLPELTAALDELPFHRRPSPKSLSNQWVVEELWPVIRDYPASAGDRLHTFSVWLAGAIRREISLQQAPGAEPLSVLVSGGGAHNGFLMDQLNTQAENLHFTAEPGPTTDFKEAALVALCALLRQEGLPNSLASATGADRDTINGALYAA
ncbi:anhydro-N-acetylmuramic acid kinase [Lewinella marina]|uniref:Anhydro-N-acetylmuramic acid kinase n=1 Tax=Neolewinella marina TaxID=438751 RepID=A0A2G0CIP4_9BACT|nr:anhydro-N-acetylmuramic acid kinase [Neolewinella marina]NJB85014.1 anhydro-N-acetylmuramic acid kinase [Neolewinella marina]PHK99836.1 anhydro-N-acetylmuramic acid kinase [Neolewinella marina]